MRLRAMSSFKETMKNNIIKPDPKTPKKKDYDFRDIEFLAMIAHAIAGGVESPLQLAFQVSALDTYLVKFIYSEKATKFREIFPLLLTRVHTVKSKGKISQNFVAFSEYMNFKNR